MKPRQVLFPLVLIFVVLVIALMIFFGTQFSVENAPNPRATIVIFAVALFVILAIVRGMHEEPPQPKSKSRRKSNR